MLKELVQNADDAGAKSISFCLDCRQNEAQSCAGPELGQFQGPALIVHNDATFSDEDFRSIQRIGDSLKKTSESKAKIGRFGIGFNAVYHWTDLPSFVSAKFLVMLDPQARFLPNVNPSNPGHVPCSFPKHILTPKMSRKNCRLGDIPKSIGSIQGSI